MIISSFLAYAARELIIPCIWNPTDLTIDCPQDVHSDNQQRQVTLTESQSQGRHTPLLNGAYLASRMSWMSLYHP